MLSEVSSLIGYLRRLSSPYKGDSDGLLLERFADGDETAFSALLDRHAPLVWGVCRRVLPMCHDAEDAFQAVFVVLARKAASLRRAEPLAPWLHRVAWRTAQKARARRIPSAPLEEQVCMMDPATGLLDRERRGLIDEEIDRLPERYRQPVLLCLIEGLTNEQAALRLGCPVGTVQSRLSRARDRLRDALHRRGVDGPAVLGALATPAVPARLLESSLPSVAPSSTVSTLAKGVLLTMTLKRFEAVLILLVLTIAGSGAWFGTRPGTPPTVVAQAVKPDVKDKEPKPNSPKEVEAPGKEKPPAVVEKPLANTLSKIRNVLDTNIEFGNEAATLGEILDDLGRRHHLQFNIDERAFAVEGVENVLGTKIGAIGDMQATVSRVLRKVLSRIPDTRATYLIRNDCIEITTMKAVVLELGPESRNPLDETSNDEGVLPLMSEDFERAELKDVFKKFAKSSGYNIILDPRAQKDKGPKSDITLQLLNVPVDVAVGLVAEMSSLSVVRRANVFFVTTEQIAAKMQKEDERKTKPYGGFPLIPPGAPGLTPPAAPQK